MEAVNLRIRKICDHLFRDSGRTRLFVNLEHKKVMTMSGIEKKTHVNTVKDKDVTAILVLFSD